MVSISANAVAKSLPSLMARQAVNRAFEVTAREERTHSGLSPQAGRGQEECVPPRGWGSSESALHAGFAVVRSTYRSGFRPPKGGHGRKDGRSPSSAH
jgi:hypothetical protein